jgi:hypothetical protein
VAALMAGYSGTPLLKCPGLVDVKAVAVDEVWSGLKLVIRVENRKG